jgi:hypothetical protein
MFRYLCATVFTYVLDPWNRLRAPKLHTIPRRALPN